MKAGCEGFKKKNDNKISEKHKQLANFIKEIHIQLRNESEIHGIEEAWKTHVTQDEKLNNYAKSMYQLATEHWGLQHKNMAPLAFCRVEWIKNQCKDYFFRKGMKKFDDVEKRLLRMGIQESNLDACLEKIETNIESKINVLDVGSCYNPFNTENLFLVTAIDIAPYSNDVIKCDFFNLKIENEKIISEDKTLIELPRNSFDAVIFSLVLEYIPCPKKRFLFCEKAYNLLKNGGILLIATPDSKHEGANTKIINTSWKVTLAKLGFMRICYEKLPHIHCLVFRKCFYKDVAMKRIQWNKIPENDEIFTSKKIFIPQDFHTIKENNLEINLESFKYNRQELITLFDELPSENL